MPFISVHQEIFKHYGHAYDMHQNNFGMLKNVNLPILDLVYPALIQDLEDRGLLDSTLVIALGEFGRTPKVNVGLGRDHWPQVSNALLACGGISTGQAIGATNRLGEYAKERPVHFHEVFATLYRNLGIDTESTTITDLGGRPRYLVDAGYRPLPELT